MPPPPPTAAQLASLHEFNVEVFTLLGVALTVTFLRVWARISQVGLNKLWADDYLVIVAVIFYSIETGMAYMVGNTAHGLANNSMTPEERANLLPSDPEYALRVMGSKIQLAGWSCYSALLWCLKAAMCTFYLRLTKEIAGYRTRIYIGFGLIIGSWMVVLLNFFFSCRPFTAMWQIYPDPGPLCYPAISPALIWTYLSMNVITDLYLILIPMPMLWKAAMPLLQRLGLMAFFSCGLLVTACALLRVILLVSDPVNGAQLAGSWAVRETFIAVFTTNLPMLFPFIKRFCTPLFSAVRSRLGMSRHSRARTSTHHSSQEKTTSTTVSATQRASSHLDNWRRSFRLSQPLSSSPPDGSTVDRMFALEEMQILGMKDDTRSATTISEDGGHLSHPFRALSSDNGDEKHEHNV